MARNKRVLRRRVENSEPRRRTVDPNDRFSSLPHDILDTILCKLPLRDAVRTSMLSYTWKYKWLFMSSLVCDYTSILGSHGETPAVRAVSRTIDNFVINHQGPGVERFALKITSDRIYSDICRWMKFLVDKGVKELIFEVPICVPNRLFAFEHLTVLQLISCSVMLPVWFEKFNFLTELYLRNVSLTEECFERLICSCTCLERLTLSGLDYLRTVRIHGQALKYLSIDINCEEAVIEDTPHLATVDIVLFTPFFSCSPYWFTLFRRLSCLRSLEKLRLYGPLPGLWTMDMSLQEVDPINSNPVTISLDDVILDDAETPKLCYWLLCSFPRTEQFYLSFTGAEGYRALRPFFVEAKKSNKLFTNLKTVTMRYSNYVGACTDLLPMGAGAEFLNFLIARSPEIQLVTLIRKGLDEHPDKTVEKIFKKLSRSFPNATLVFKPGGSSSAGLDHWEREFPHYCEVDPV